MTNIKRPEDMKLVDTIILNGLIGYCDTHDDNSETVGVKVVQKVKRLSGEVAETVVDSFPFTKEMCEKCGWRGRYASIQMLIGSTPIEANHIDETKVVSMTGRSSRSIITDIQIIPDICGLTRCSNAVVTTFPKSCAPI